MQDPTAKWTQKMLMELADVGDRRSISQTLHFVDDMMRLKDEVFKVQSIRKTIHHFATTKEPVTQDIWRYIEEEQDRFRSTCRYISLACLSDYPNKIYALRLSKAKTQRLLNMIRATSKFIDQIRNTKDTFADMKKIIANYNNWRWHGKAQTKLGTR